MSSLPAQIPLAVSPLTGRSRLTSSLRCRRVDRPPLWFMRQAGRHLPGYRKLRESHSFLDICRPGDANFLASIEPLHRYAVDAVIVFNDILIPLMDMGMQLDFAPAPRFAKLLQSEADIATLATPTYDQTTDVARCIERLRTEVGESAGVLGFVGAPFTVAAFAIAGVGVNPAELPSLLERKQSLFPPFLDRLIGVLADYAQIQVDAGADAIQIFESWAEKLTPATYRRLALPALLELVRQLQARSPHTPIIVFGRGLTPFATDLAPLGVTLSIEPNVPLTLIRRTLKSAGFTNPLQGNLPPETLCLTPDQARQHTIDLLAQWPAIVPFPAEAPALGPTGWVFNLGHGVPADAHPDTVAAVADTLRAFDFTHPAAAESPAEKQVSA